MKVQYVGTANSLSLFITSEPLHFTPQEAQDLPANTANHLLGLKQKDGTPMFVALDLESGGATTQSEPKRRTRKTSEVTE